MNLNPATGLDPVFHFLDWVIAEWGVYLYLVFVWLSLILIAWIFSGGLRRKFPNQPHVGADIGIIIQPHRPPPPPSPPIIIYEYDPRMIKKRSVKRDWWEHCRQHKSTGYLGVSSGRVGCS